MAYSTEQFGVTGLGLREVIQRVSDHACRENTGGTFVTWNTTNHAAIIARTLAETEIVAATQSRYTPAAFPAVAAGWYRVLVWSVASNTVIAATPDFYWDGSDIVQIANGAITSAKFSVSAPSGVASGILEKIDQLWRRFFKRTVYDGTNLKTYADDGTSVLTTQALGKTGTTQTQGAAS